MKLLFFLSFVMSATAFASPCGLEGSIEERIKSCNLMKETFVLVTRTDKGLEVFKDTKTGMVWGDRIIYDFNHYGSQKACGDDLPEALLLKEIKWRLPTVREFEVAASHGMKTSISHMDHFFWTSTPVKSKRRRTRRSPPAQVFLWDGQENKTDVGDIKDAASVRCIGQHST